MSEKKCTKCHSLIIASYPWTKRSAGRCVSYMCYDCANPVKKELQFEIVKRPFMGYDLFMHVPGFHSPIMCCGVITHADAKEDAINIAEFFNMKAVFPQMEKK